jgi:hypothetical protein
VASVVRPPEITRLEQRAEEGEGEEEEEEEGGERMEGWKVGRLEIRD